MTDASESSSYLPSQSIGVYGGVRMSDAFHGEPVGPRLKAFAQWSSSTFCTMRLRTPQSICPSPSGSAAAYSKYGCTCHSASRSHMAGMSPVITNVSGRPSP
eukprot:Amastigsp_a347724_3.p6 type:complete len:102 gc:universal Amastigsp_a347724_3:524-219(-)